MPTSENKKAGDYSILAGVLTKKRETQNICYFKKSIMNRTI